MSCADFVEEMQRGGRERSGAGAMGMECAPARPRQGEVGAGGLTGWLTPVWYAHQGDQHAATPIVEW